LIAESPAVESGQSEELERESLIVSEDEEGARRREKQFRESNVLGACGQLFEVRAAH